MIKKIAIVFAIIILLTPSYTFSAELIGTGCSTAFLIDSDCDGYGVSSPLGPDCDDADPAKHAPDSHADALTNYIPTGGDVFYVATDGDNDTGIKNDLSKPFATIQGAESQINPGDTVVYRGGVYNLYGGSSIRTTKGTEEGRVTIMAYPGESTIIRRYNVLTDTTQYETFGGTIAAYGDVIYDGFIIEYGATGFDLSYQHNVTIRNCTIREMWIRGIFGMQNLDNILVENNVIHDVTHDNGTVPSHGIYFGARDQPNKNIKINRNIMYRCMRTGFQHNGPIPEGLVFSNNIVHSVELSGISLDNGVKNAIIANNIIFNNNKSPIVIQSHHQPDYNITGEPNQNNLFINNVLWTGRDDVLPNLGMSEPSNFHCVEFDMPQDNSYEESGRHSGNTFINNTCTSYGGSFVKYYNFEDYKLTEFHNNIFYHTKQDNSVAIRADIGDGSHDDLIYGFPYWYFNSTLGSGDSKNTSNINTDSGVVSASLDDALQVGNFNFEPLASSSPTIDAGKLHVNAPVVDFKGRTRINAIDVGVYEWDGASPTCAESPFSCDDQSECITVGWNWCDEICQTESCTLIRANVDQQNGINATDAMLVLRSSLGLDMSETAWQASATTGDVNCDGTTNISDALLILKYSLGFNMSGTDWCE